ncbi:MAG: alpha/beta fold hydrolase, partial [Paracoccaceae bacterium]
LLEKEFQAIRPDNRTCGQTVPWNAPASMELWVQDLIALLDHLKHDRIHVVGHSLGGIIGWALAHHFPERVASLLMIGSSAIPAPRNGELFRALLDIRRSDAAAETWLRVLYPWLLRKEAFKDRDAINTAIAAGTAYPHAQTADAMELQLATLAKTDPTPFRAAPKVPCRAILSHDDLLVPFDDAIGSLKGFDVVETSGLGHSLHWDDPDFIASEVRRMIDENRA